MFLGLVLSTAVSKAPPRWTVYTIFAFLKIINEPLKLRDASLIPAHQLDAHLWNIGILHF